MRTDGDRTCGIEQDGDRTCGIEQHACAQSAQSAQSAQAPKRPSAQARALLFLFSLLFFLSNPRQSCEAKKGKANAAGSQCQTPRPFLGKLRIPCLRHNGHDAIDARTI